MSKRRKTKAGIWFSFRPIVLLVLTTAFLILSTYAWFTSNTLVQIESLEIYVQASEGFQISLDATNWKTIIQASEITGNAIGQPYNVNETYGANENHVPAEMKPVSTGITTNSDGYMDMFTGLAELDELIGSPTRNQYIFSATEITETRGSGATGGDFIAFDLFFKTTFNIELHLDYAADAVDNAAVDSPNKNKGMENSARIAFVKQGLIPMSSFLSGNQLASAAQVLKHTATSDGSNVTVWEPNYNTHTEQAKTEMFQLFGISTTDPIWTSGRIDYDGIIAAINRTTPILLTENNATSKPTYFRTIPGTQIVTTEKNTRNSSYKYSTYGYRIRTRNY